MKKVFNSTITLSNEIVRDHQIHGQALLPGLAYVDMIFQLAQETIGIDFRKYGLSDVAILCPLRVSQDCPVDVAISFEETQSGWSVAVDGQERDAFGTRSPTRRYAAAALEQQNGIPFHDQIDIASLKSKSVEHVDMDLVYAQARTRGLVHQGSIKAKGVVYINGAGCLAEVYVENNETGVSRYLVHPTLLDGSAMASTVLGRTGNGNNGDQLYIPLHYQSFVCTQPLRTSCYSILQLSSFRRTRDIQKMDIDFYDAAGRQIAALRGLTTKAVRNPDQMRFDSIESNPSRQYPSSVSRVAVPAAAEIACSGSTTTAGTIETALRRIYSAYLQVEPSQLDLDIGFFDLGFESSQLLAVLKETEKAFGISLSPTLLFEKSNLRELIDHIRHASAGEQTVVPSTSAVIGDLQSHRAGGSADFFPHHFSFSGDEPFLQDHLVFGQPALMGVTYPCLALECGRTDGAKDFPVTLEDIQFAGGPLTLRKGERATIRVQLGQENGQQPFSTVCFTSTPENARLCCSGHFTRDDSFHRPRVAISRIIAQSRGLNQTQIDKFYSAVKDFTIGPMLRVIESAWVHQDSTLVLKISLAGKMQKGSLSGLTFDPLLLNACYFFLDGSRSEPREKILIPLFIERLRVFRPMTEKAYVVNTLRVKKQDYVAFDAMVFTESGECIAEVVNASLKEVANPETLTNASFEKASLTSSLPDKIADRRPSGNALDIAIVGLAGRYPQSRDVQALWKVLRDGKDCITEIPEDRWNWREYYSEDRKEPGSMHSKWGGFIEDMDRFDPRFFGISPREAELMDPQERLFLEHAWMALEDAGYTRQKLQTIGAPDVPGNVGVYVGVMSQEYPLYAAEANARGARLGVGSNLSTIATRVSFTCDLHGPSMVIDTMCSSSLTAIETAARALADHRIDAALAGGVNLTIHPNKYLMLSQGQFISSKGRCESFGQGGDGYIPGEGVGVLFLKRLSDAERDGDHIYGVIKGAALNHGGRAGGYTVPNPKAQSRVIARALKESCIHPETVSYIEAHGTGTKLGDPVEIAGLCAAYSETTNQKQFCWLGSVKSNIGHCEAAAGVAGITKVLLQMRYGKIVPSLHSKVSNPAIDFENTPFIVNQVLREWKRPVWNGQQQPRRAGVSSFGAGGSNAHVILEEYLPEGMDRRDSAQDTGMDCLIVLSAREEDRLTTLVKNLHTTITRNDPSDRNQMNLSDLAYTLQTGREAMEIRLGLVVRSISQLADKLALFLQDPAHDSFYYEDVRHHKATLAFLTGDEDFGQLLHTWFLKQKYGNLLDFWVKGGTVEWEKLYPDRHPRRLSLPVYPFSRERYWLPIDTGKSKAVREQVTSSPRQAQGEDKSADLPLMSFEEIWQETALPEVSAPRAKSLKTQTLVCFLSDAALQDRVLEHIQYLFPECEVIFISSDRHFKRSSSKAYGLPSQDPDSLKLAFQNIHRDFGDIHTIVYLWALDDPSFVRDPAPIVHSIQALAAAKIKPGMLTLGGLARNAVDLCYLESWIGFERSLKQLLPDTQVTVVLGDGKAQDYRAGVWQYLGQLASEVCLQERRSVLYSEGRRYACKVRPLSLTSGDPILRIRGTYLITGGFGGLGYLFAEYLAKRYQANLILAGRSSVDEDRQEKLRALSRTGAQAAYIATDLSNESDLRTALAGVRSRFGPIHGIIHAAGSQRPESILDKDLNAFQSVLAPKVQGTLVLDSLFATEPLDFVCYFSSSSAILGDFGSCDYAVGNRFQMAYGRYRNQQQTLGNRAGATVVINWPLWRDGGMRFGDNRQSEMYLKSSGQRFLETDEGIETFERLLNQRQEQCLVLTGFQGRIHRFLGIDHDASSPVPITSDPSPCNRKGATRHDPPRETVGLTVEQYVIRDLKNCVSDILKIPAAELDITENWIDFGFDSVTLTELATELTRHFGLEINPVQFYGYPTIESFASHLLTEHKEVLHSVYAREVSPVLPGQRQSEIRPAVPTKASPGTPEPIAIIGLSGRFPQSRSIDEMWELLANGREAVEEIPADRFDWRLVYGNPTEDVSKTNGKWCGCIPGVHEFDPLFFEISPREAEVMDPRQRLLLMEAWKALEDAGYGILHLRQGKVGMFVGVESSEHAIPAGKNAGITANHDAILAARLAYFLNLRGPNLAINTACSSGLVATHLACQSLRNQECDTAIAAGVNVLLKPDAFVLMGQAGMLSSDGKSFAFDKRANGIVPAEAVVAVVLKRLSKAESDGDPIYAVLRGSGINYDGKTNGITAPSGVSQTELMTETCTRCGISPDAIDYVVTHGTATQLGDPIEVNALFDAFRGHTDRTNYCALTSNKPNFGHTMAASGLVSLVNLVQAMRHEVIPASLHCATESDFVRWSRTPFFVNKSNKPWPRSTARQRFGAVSSFGISGTNALLLMQDYQGASAEPSPAGTGPTLLVLSAKSKEALSRKIQEMIAWSESEAACKQSLLQASFTLLVGRQHFEYRYAIVASDWEEAKLLWDARMNDSSRDFSRCEVSRDSGVQDLLRQGQETSGDSAQYKELLWTLADRYCQGHDLDWEMLFGQSRPERIHLPTYPFSRQSYGGNSAVPTKPNSIRDVQKPEFELDDYLVELVAGHLKLPLDELEFDKDLDEYGLDSIEAAALLRKMTKTFGDVPQSLFLEHRTLDEVRTYLRQNLAPKIEAFESADSPEQDQAQPTAPLPSQSLQPIHSSSRRTGNVSIIGMAGLFPGAPSIEAFVNLLRDRKVAISGLPERRRLLLGLNGCLSKEDPLYGGYLEDIEYFDYRLFKLSLAEARAMDPQFRKLLEVISKAIADAGTTLKQFKTARTGLYVATKGNSGYQDLFTSDNGHRMPSETPALYANRVSNILNLLGPSEVVDTGCSSFLVAIKQAMTALRDGRCEQAIVATGELDLSPSRRARGDAIGLYTRGPDTRSFGSDSDGYVKSEVIGAIIIKPEETAIRDGSPIYASIKGVGVCHGGKAPLKWYSPNIRGQKLAIEEALADSGIEPDTVTYVEPEANGSQLGDASEITAIQSIYGRHFKAASQMNGGGTGPKMRIGSLKPLIGHAENGSTFTSLVKLIYSMRSGRLHEVHGLKEVNKGIVLEDEFEILREETLWPRLKKDQEIVPRRGAINSLAVGGVNAHLILEEPKEIHPRDKLDRDVFVFVFSEESGEKLRQLIEDYRRFLERFEQDSPAADDLLRMEYTLQEGREEYPHRLAVVATSLGELRSRLQAWLEAGPSPQQVCGSHENAESGSPAESSGSPCNPVRIKLNELAREWIAGKTIDWNSIRPSRPIQRLNLPANPLARHLCWHESLRTDSDGEPRTSSAGTLFLTPRWTSKVGSKPIVEPPDCTRTVIFCDWEQEKLTSVAAQLDRDREFITLHPPADSPADRRFVHYTSAVFEVVKQAIQSHSAQTGKSVFVQVVVPSDIESIHLQGIAGLLRTARKEHSHFTGQLIALAPTLAASTIVSRLHDNFLRPADTLVRYVSDERQIQVWDPMPVTIAPIGSRSVWKDGGVFLITGGAGGLGLITARHIARQSRASTLILAGRSPLSARIKKAADEIHALGARVIYEQVDITDKSQANILIETILKDCGLLTGIIHCAGVVDDKSLLNKTASEVENVLRPKVSGLCNLDEATKSLPLDYFVLFSSVAAVFGNPGQADYAAGNAFMNSYSVFRNHLVKTGQRQGQTLAINWPLWSEGGMNMDDASRALLKRIYEIHALPTDEGLRALELSILSTASEVCVLYGGLDRLMEFINTEV